MKSSSRQESDFPTTVSVSVIIPSLNEKLRIGKTIQSCLNAEADEVIVCDGGSSDRTLEIVQQTTATLIHSRQGRGYQLASGARAATGDVFLFLHADCVLGPDCIRQIRNRLQILDGTCWGCFRHVIDSRNIKYRFLERGNVWRAKRRGEVFGDQAMWVRRDTYDSAGGFAEVAWLEDAMLSREMRKISPPKILPGPVTIPDRHWKRGVIKTTLRNRRIMKLFRDGLSADEIANQIDQNQNCIRKRK